MSNRLVYGQSSPVYGRRSDIHQINRGSGIGIGLPPPPPPSESQFQLQHEQNLRHKGKV